MTVADRSVIGMPLASWTAILEKNLADVDLASLVTA